ncbi:tetratricopeptide repeat protein [Hirschia baltica]|uniref:Tetratricopeptide TPR_2 repeat protein n=1 Tax=Hirschia baltica (strain ATCC 49814 / DSM 5838 / IFAM 1418) TaxID=582402 RepID=C6XPN4_HIRBI|nr:hypothetical protein [Hirschia baltica]ACT60299.1 Tetratricopeptide TPR_2 repeat protein [Hirschia baltica ATCC 49814]
MIKANMVVTILAFSIVAACEKLPPSEVEEPGGQITEATSFTGEPLLRRVVSETQKEENEGKILKIKEQDSLSEDDFMKLGKLLAANKQYQDAIAAYSEGLKIYPESFKLLRHRAHRYLTTRQVEAARADLVLANSLNNALDADAIEFKNGHENGTYRHWIGYHLGIAELLLENYEASASAFRDSLATSSNDNEVLGVVDWLYTVYNLAGNVEAAEKVLENVPADTGADASYPYYDRVMLYKGLRTAAEVIDLEADASNWSAKDITLANGVANWMLFQGRPEEAAKVYDAILATPYWDIWAYLTAEHQLTIMN